MSYFNLYQIIAEKTLLPKEVQFLLVPVLQEKVQKEVNIEVQNLVHYLVQKVQQLKKKRLV